MTRVMTVAAVSLLAFQADVRAQEGFRVGYTDLGAVIGLGGIGEASIAIGGRFERGIKALPNMGNGVLGIEASIDWWQFSTSFGDWRYIPVSATGNYHFRVEGGKWDPFLGAGLGMWIVDAPDCGPIDCDYSSGVYFVGRAGVRYFFSPAMAFYADAGAGASTFNVGVTFKLSGGQ